MTRHVTERGHVTRDVPYDVTRHVTDLSIGAWGDRRTGQDQI